MFPTRSATKVLNCRNINALFMSEVRKITSVFILLRGLFEVFHNVYGAGSKKVLPVCFVVQGLILLRV